MTFGIGRCGAIVGPVIGGILLQVHATLFQCFLGFAVPALIAFLAVLVIQDKYSYTQNIGKRQAQIQAAGTNG